MPSMLGQREDGGDQKRSRLTIILPVVVLIILMTVGFYEINGESLDPRGTDFRIIVTDSMDGEETDFEIPTIPVDSLVTVKHLDIDEFDDVKVGDVVAYDFNGMMIVHRVIQNDSESDHFLLKFSGFFFGKNFVFGNLFSTNLAYDLFILFLFNKTSISKFIPNVFA